MKILGFKYGRELTVELVQLIMQETFSVCVDKQNIVITDSNGDQAGVWGIEDYVRYDLCVGYDEVKVYKVNTQTHITIEKKEWRDTSIYQPF